MSLKSSLKHLSILLHFDCEPQSHSGFRGAKLVLIIATIQETPTRPDGFDEFNGSFATSYPKVAG